MTITKFVLFYSVFFLFWFIAESLRIIYFQFKPESISYKLDKYEDKLKNSSFYLFLFFGFNPLFAIYSTVVLLLATVQFLLNKVE